MSRPNDPQPDLIPATGTIVKQTALALLILGGAGVCLFAAADRFAAFEQVQDAKRDSRPRVNRTLPIDGDTIAVDQASFRAELFLPVVGAGVDAATLLPQAVRLVDDATGAQLPGRLSVAADGGSVSLTPDVALQPGTTYRFEITGELLDTEGNAFIPYVSVIRTGKGSPRAQTNASIAYELEGTIGQLDRSIFTALAWGPGTTGGRDLFAATADGRIFRYDIASDGLPVEVAMISTMLASNGGPRLVTGMAFDPNDPSTLWVSHMTMALTGADDFTGKLSTLSGPAFDLYADRVVGLPRAFKDHGNFGLAFAPDRPDSLYLSQGSNTGHGGRDSKWNYRPERPLTAAMLHVDLAALPTDGPLDVSTPTDAESPFAGGSYDPTADGAAVTVHATGIRSGYTPIFHSSGKLLVAINGAGAGGNTPPVRDDNNTVVEGPLMAIGSTTPDTLADVTKPGTYHGHPNPFRGEDVLMGGNPTDSVDPFEISAYPVGIAAEPNFAKPVFDFGRGYSVNGLAESKADVFDGTIKGDLFAARYSSGDDVVLLDLDEAGNVLSMHTGINGLTNLGSPLNILEDPDTGRLFITEADTNSLRVFRPVKPE